jgi:hypothetical protein
MEKRRLLETLAELRANLAQAENVDPETIARLETLTADIERELGKPGAEKPKEPTSSHGLKDKLLEFEAEHPQLSVAIGKVADALAAMGI